MQYQNQQTGTTQQCDSWSTVPVYQNQCVQFQTVQIQDKLRRYRSELGVPAAEHHRRQPDSGPLLPL